ncbi:UNVERIFIED_CONTAM: hypothetical protein PYX00_011589 [Menopon gallinae]|uniref:t-SNARE coiled-coil homology domain-containing protein n=1 Tax=Menopon gallinae TaxID=328185 RepID=A0AAW2H881_9NEOP
MSSAHHFASKLAVETGHAFCFGFLTSLPRYAVLYRKRTPGAVLARSVRVGGSFARYSMYHRASRSLLDAAVGPMRPLPSTVIPAFVTSMVLARQYGLGYAIKNSIAGVVTSLLTDEYHRYLGVDSAADPRPYEDRFFDTIVGKMNTIADTLGEKRSYSQVLVSERDLGLLARESSELLGMIEIEGTADEVAHFRGIKEIISLRMASLALKIQQKKQSFITYTANLEPERPVVFTQNTLPVFEEENRRLVERFRSETSELTVARRRLLEIEALQDLISLHLCEQNERIDTIALSAKSAKQNINKSNTYFMKNRHTGRLMRRVLFIFLLCISFVLLTTYFFNR